MHLNEPLRSKVQRTGQQPGVYHRALQNQYAQRAGSARQSACDLAHEFDTSPNKVYDEDISVCSPIIPSKQTTLDKEDPWQFVTHPVCNMA
jgi:hypothetical protein